jgi:protein-L-isoaspartate(D-aspartate) O-methyltransferase
MGTVRIGRETKHAAIVNRITKRYKPLTHGYQAAVLARLAATVYSVEIIPWLGEQAQTRLKQLGFNNVQIKIGDGFFGWQERAPFDAILFTAAAPEIPPPLWRQLREGGQVILPRGGPGQIQRLTRVRKRAGKQEIEPLNEVIFVPLTGVVEKRSQ